MLRRVVVAQADCFLGIVGDIDDSLIAPGEAGDFASRQNRELLFQLIHRLPRKVLAQADEADAAVGVVLGLPQQIAGHQRGIGVIVGDHQNLGRPRQQIDTAAPEELALGFGHEAVARAAQHVHRLQSIQPEGHQRQRRNPAQNINRIRPGLLNRVDRSRIIALPLHRRRAGGNRVSPPPPSPE